MTEANNTDEDQGLDPEKIKGDPLCWWQAMPFPNSTTQTSMASSVSSSGTKRQSGSQTPAAKRAKQGAAKEQAITLTFCECGENHPGMWGRKRRVVLTLMTCAARGLSAVAASPILWTSSRRAESKTTPTWPRLRSCWCAAGSTCCCKTKRMLTHSWRSSSGWFPTRSSWTGGASVSSTSARAGTCALPTRPRSPTTRPARAPSWPLTPSR